MIKALFRKLNALRSKRRNDKELAHLGALADLPEEEPGSKREEDLAGAMSALKLGLSGAFVAKLYGRAITEEAVRANEEAS